MTKNIKPGWLMIAGLIGGLAEVFWISIYSAFTDTQASVVCSAISATFMPTMSSISAAPFIGLVIHLVLSIILAIGFGKLLYPIVKNRFENLGLMVTAIVTLAVIWKINFFVILPAINPAFVSLLPLSITLVSKLLFGLAMGSVLVLYNKKAII